VNDVKEKGAATLPLGRTGNLPVPLGNLPSGMERRVSLKIRRWFVESDAVSVPSGKLPDGTGSLPMLPNAIRLHPLLIVPPLLRCPGGGCQMRPYHLALGYARGFQINLSAKVK